MKRTFKSIISVAATAMVFTACNVEPAPVGTEGTHTVSFVVSQDGTKTTMDIKDGVASFDWEEADVNFFYLFENEVGNLTKPPCCPSVQDIAQTSCCIEDIEPLGKRWEKQQGQATQDSDTSNQIRHIQLAFSG